MAIQHVTPDVIIFNLMVPTPSPERPRSIVALCRIPHSIWMGFRVLVLPARTDGPTFKFRWVQLLLPLLLARSQMTNESILKDADGIYDEFSSPEKAAESVKLKVRRFRMVGSAPETIVVKSRTLPQKLGNALLSVSMVFVFTRKADYARISMHIYIRTHKQCSPPAAKTPSSSALTKTCHCSTRDGSGG